MPAGGNGVMIRRSLISAALVMGVVMTGSPASAQITQEGLINVAIDDATVQVPIAVAANVCGVAVNVLSQDLQDGDATCDALATSVSRNEGGGGGPVRQEGLVNVAVTDLVVQVPIGVAANICGVAVNVLVQDSRTGDVICEAEGVARAFR
jgi:hypothetical protein